MFEGKKIRFGTQPIAWSNDDFRDLGGETSLETCLGEMREAGFEGTEVGHKFPKDPSVLAPILRKFGMSLVSGWHSTYILENSLESEMKSWIAHLEFLKAMGCNVAVAAECSRRVYENGKLPLRAPSEANGMTDADWSRLATGIEALAMEAEGRGMKLAYHYHMGTVVQNQAEVERFLSMTDRTGIVLDTGHATFAGMDALQLAKTYSKRVAHVHLKNTRSNVVDAARREKWSFERAVRAGVFTVPGDGGLDFAPVLSVLDGSGYEGWLVVEAEQDPEIANPLGYAMRARAYLKSVTGL